MLSPRDTVQTQLYQRLRQPASAHTIPGALPILFFGDLFTARLVTVGLNPSWHEYLDDRRRELAGDAQRFETLGSLGATDRASLAGEQCERAIARMRMYFEHSATIYPWFRSLARVTDAMGAPYKTGQAAHLDLVQEATDPVWSQLRRMAEPEAFALLNIGLEYLRQMLAIFPIERVVCNGRTALAYVIQLTGGNVVARGQTRRITWSAGTGRVNGKVIVLAGWNIPLDKPTGLTQRDETTFGHTLVTELDRIQAVG
jgi:hypothetical protein